MTKYFTDGLTAVEAETRAGAFDKLQEHYGHSDIGDIYRANLDTEDGFRVGYGYVIFRGTGYTYNPSELPYSIKDSQW
jgi:hypothetical protein